MYAGRVYADFQNLDDENRVRLTTAGTRRDLAEAGFDLVEGSDLPLYTDDADETGQPDPLFAEGRVEYNSEERCWVARVDWSALRHASEQHAERSTRPPPTGTERARPQVDPAN